MKTAVIYARYSSNAQTEQSIEGQLRVCNEYAKTNGYVIVDTYIDRAITGTTDNRPAFLQMIADSAKKQWENVIVYKLDRFSRDKMQATIHKYNLKQNGVKVISATENIPETPEGMILEGLIEVLNQYFIADLSQKVKRGMRETRNKGHWQGGKLRYGYKLEDKKIVVDEEQAEVVRHIFREYSRGIQIKTIIDDLTNRGILYKGEPFKIKTVYSMLRNSKYTGMYVLGDEIVDKLYPQIIDESTYEMVRKKVDANKHGKHPKVQYLLRHKLICGYCGESLIAESGTSKNGEKKYYYKCHGRKNLHNGCQKSIERKDDLEKLVVNHIIKELKSENTVNIIVQKLIEYQESFADKNIVLINLVKEQKTVKTAMENIISAIELGIINNATKSRLDELEKRKNELETQILIEESKTTIKLTERQIREFYEKALELEPITLINYFVKQIIVYDDEMDITVCSPIEISPDKCRGLLFYSKIFSVPIYKRNGNKNGQQNKIIKMSL
ncbi:MAG: recombinase family protein [Clostridia bacterium]|nr:recombinase family protein [Clostridia bacterium]